MRDPDSIALRMKLQRRFLLLVVPIHRCEMLPVLAVIAEEWDRVRVHRHRAGLVVVLADKIRERERHLAITHVVHAEVVPVRLTIAPALVVLALHVTTECRIAEFLDFPKRGTFETGVE